MNTTPILASSFPGWLIPVIIVAVFGLIVLFVIILKKHVKIFQNKEEPKSDKEIAAEELDRVLQPIDDPEAEKAMQNFDEKSHK